MSDSNSEKVAQEPLAGVLDEKTMVSTLDCAAPQLSANVDRSNQMHESDVHLDPLAQTQTQAEATMKELNVTDDDMLEAQEIAATYSLEDTKRVGPRFGVGSTEENADGLIRFSRTSTGFTNVIPTSPSPPSIRLMNF